MSGESIIELSENHLEIDEIFVVSSGSTDNTNNIVNEISLSDSRVKLLTQDKRMGKASAINEFLKSARGDILILESADTYTDSDTITKLIKPFMQKQNGMVGAHPIPVNDIKTFI